jgi:putative NADPH-quinone reductase
VKILLVFCHPRRRSLTGAIADAFADGAAAEGHDVEFADLYVEGFDPCLGEPGEPDWDVEDKRYSDAVHAEMQRMERNDAVVPVFPVWWWSMPAMLKGWIDRVWSLGSAYGPKTLKHRHGLAIGVAAASAQAFAKRGYDQAFSTQFTTGIMNYCGIDHAHSEILHNSTDDLATRKRLLSRARNLGEAFPTE